MAGSILRRNRKANTIQEIKFLANCDRSAGLWAGTQPLSHQIAKTYIQFFGECQSSMNAKPFRSLCRIGANSRFAIAIFVRSGRSMGDEV